MAQSVGYSLLQYESSSTIIGLKTSNQTPKTVCLLKHMKETPPPFKGIKQQTQSQILCTLITHLSYAPGLALKK